MSGIYVAGDAVYGMKVSQVLEKIKSYSVGRTIVQDIKSTGKNLEIQPYHDGKSEVFGPCNATTKAKSPTASAPKGVGKGAPWFRGDSDNRLTPDDERNALNPPRFVGTGKGSEVKVHFSPESWGPRRQDCFQGQNGSLPDEVLLHEMVHGLRKMQGKHNPWPTDLKGYENEEEFLAVVVANVYMSEKGSQQLRADHDGHWPLRPPLDTSTGFLADQNNLKILKIHHLVWRPTFLNLATITTAKFNPFRQLVHDLAYLSV